MRHFSLPAIATKWRRSLVAVTAFAMAAAGLTLNPLGQVTASADAWTQDKAGVDTVTAVMAEDPETLAHATSTVPDVNPNALYAIDGGGMVLTGNVAIIDTVTGLRTQQYAAGSVPAVEQISLAVDYGQGVRSPGFYTWYRGPQPTSAPAGMFPLWFYEPGQTDASKVFYLPDNEHFGASGEDFAWSSGGGAVNQVTGQLYMKLGFEEFLGADSKLRLMIFDPQTRDTYWSGQLQAATGADDLWTAEPVHGGTGYVSPGMVVTASGDFCFLVRGTDKDIAANDPMNITDKDIAAGDTHVSFLVKVHPTFNNDPWTYSVLKMVVQDPNDHSGHTIEGVQMGLSYLDGKLYLEVGANLFSVDPGTGYWKYVANVGSKPIPQDGLFYALSSAQTATSITGRVVVAATEGVFSAADTPAPGQTVALYQQISDGPATLVATASTNGSGEYSFFAPGAASDGSISYYVQVVQPTLEGRGAQVTAGGATGSAENTAQLVCGDGTITSSGTPAFGACQSTPTTPALVAIGSEVDLGDLGAYGQVTLRDSWTDPRVDFALTGDPAPDPVPAPGQFYCGDAEGTGIYPGTQTKTVDQTASVYGLVTDEYCTPIPGIAVTMTFTSPNNSATVSTADAGASVDGLTVTGVTDANGKVNVNITDTKIETVTASGTMAAGLTMGSAAASFTVGAPVPGPLSCPDPANPGQTIPGTGIYASPTSVNAGGTSLITALVTDQYCHPVPYVPVDLAASTPGQLANLSGDATGLDGTVTATLSANGSGTVTVTGTYGESQPMGQADVAFAAAPEAPEIKSPTTGEAINTPDVTVEGLADPGVNITVSDGNGNGCTTTADDEGAWSCQIEGLDDGEVTLTATADDGEGNVSEESDPVTFTVDTVAPEAPEIKSPTTGAAINSNDVTVEGLAEPGSTVTVTDEAGNQCITTAGEDGKWSCEMTFDEGDHTLTATATDKAGNVSEDSDPVTFTVDTVAPDAPEITSPADGTAVNSNDVTVEGTAEPGATVTVTDEAGNQCITTAEEDGTWSCEMTFDEGDHTLTATATDKAGNVSEETDTSFEVKTSTPGDPTLDPTNGSQVTGTTDPDTTVTVLDGKGKPLDGCTDVQPDENGRWSCAPTTPPEAGSQLTGVAKDKAGNTSGDAQVTVLQLGIEVDKPQAQAGDPQKVTGTNFNPGEKVHLTIGSWDGGVATADDTGQVVFEFDMPALPAGDYKVVLTGEQSGKAVAAAKVAGDAADVKASTGGHTMASGVFPLAAIGLLVGAAAALLVWRQRRVAAR